MKCRVFIETATGRVKSSVKGPDFVLKAQPVPAGCSHLDIDEPARLPTRDSHYFDGEALVAMPARQGATDTWEPTGKRWIPGLPLAVMPSLGVQLEALWAELQAQPGGLKSAAAKAVAAKIAAAKTPAKP